MAITLYRWPDGSLTLTRENRMLGTHTNWDLTTDESASLRRQLLRLGEPDREELDDGGAA